MDSINQDHNTQRSINLANDDAHGNVNMTHHNVFSNILMQHDGANFLIQWIFVVLIIK